MEQLFILLAGDLGALRFAALILLPFLYLKDAAEVQKEFGDVFKDLVDRGDKSGKKPGEPVLRSVHDRLYIFELEWWLIAAAAVLLVGVSVLGDVAAKSAWLPEGCTRPTLIATQKRVEQTSSSPELTELLQDLRGRIETAGPQDIDLEAKLGVSLKDSFGAQLSIAGKVPSSQYKKSVQLVRGALNGFAIVLALAGMFVVRWSRMGAHKALQEMFYLELVPTVAVEPNAGDMG